MIFHEAILAALITNKQVPIYLITITLYKRTIRCHKPLDVTESNTNTCKCIVYQVRLQRNGLYRISTTINKCTWTEDPGSRRLGGGAGGGTGCIENGSELEANRFGAHSLMTPVIHLKAGRWRQCRIYCFFFMHQYYLVFLISLFPQ